MTLDAMSRAEWESLCDGCGRCCLHKLRDDETNELAFTNVACRLLTIETSRCADYEHRRRWVPDCVKLTPKRLKQIDWLPPPCAPRPVGQGRCPVASAPNSQPISKGRPREWTRPCSAA